MIHPPTLTVNPSVATPLEAQAALIWSCEAGQIDETSSRIIGAYVAAIRNVWDQVEQALEDRIAALNQPVEPDMAAEMKTRIREIEWLQEHLAFARNGEE